MCVCVCIRSGEDNLAAGRCAFFFFLHMTHSTLRALFLTIKPVLGLRALLLTFRIKPVLGLHASIGPSCYPFYSQDRLCSASCRKSTFFHALLLKTVTLLNILRQQSSFNFAIFFAQFFSLRDRRDGILKKTNQTRQAFGTTVTTIEVLVQPHVPAHFYVLLWAN